MKKIFSFLAVVLFAGSMMADSYTISFKDTGTDSDSSAGLTSETPADYIASGVEYVSSVAATGKVYNARTGRGLKFGNSSNSGAVTLTLASPVTATSIVVSARAYNDTEGNIKIQDKEDYAATTTVADYTYTYATPTEISAITVGTATKRGYIISVTVNYGEGGGGEEPTMDYYVAGSMTNWGPMAAYKLAANPANEGEYMGEFTFAANDEFKVGYSDGITIESTNYFPNGIDNNYVINEAGEYTVYFRPDGQGGEGWHYGFIYAAKKEAPADPTNCAEAAAAALSVSANNELYNNGAVYTITGYVTAIATAYNDNFHNISFWMADAADGGNVLEAYRAACASEADAPVVGDKVAVTGTLTKYNTTPEFSAACTFEILEQAGGDTPGGDDPAVTDPTNCAEAAAAALSVENNNDLYNNGAVYTIEGYVTSIQTAYNDNFHNISFWIADTQDGGEVLQAYRAACESEEAAPAVGDKVQVTGTLTKYNTTAEFSAGCTFVIVEQAGGDTPGGDDPAVTDPTNCAEAAAAALSVSTNNELYNNGAVYTIEGYVTSIQTAYNDNFHNISFWIADTQDGGEVLQAYRAACESEEAAPAVGDKVQVTGTLTKYNTTAEFSAGCTFVIVEQAGGDTPGGDDPAVTDPTNCAEAAAAALSVSENNELYNNGAVYTIEGYVTSIQTAYNDNFHNISFWIADTQDGGEVLQAYRAACESEEAAPAVGDKVQVTGTLTKYNTTAEFSAGCTFVIVEQAGGDTPGGDDPAVTDPTNCAEAAAAALSVSTNNELYNEGAVYTIEGYVTSIQTAYNDNFHNISFWIADTQDGGEVLQAYRAACESEEAAPAVGDKVQVTGTLTKYNTTAEFSAGCTFVIVEQAGGDTPGGDDPAVTDPTNCAEAAAAALSVSTNNELYNNGAVYTIEGYVTSIQTAYNDNFHNISFWIADTQDGGEVLQAYRAACESEEAAPAVGDKVQVTGTLTKYNTTAEFSAGCTFVIVEQAGGDTPGGDDPAVTDPTNCAEAAAAALSVSTNNELYNNGAVYTIEGYVTSIQTAYNDNFHNISFWIADTQDGGEVLQAYRAACESEEAAPAVGDKVQVTGTLTKYNTTAEFSAGCTFVIVEQAGGDTPGGDDPAVTDPTNCAEAAAAALSVSTNNELYNEGAVYTIEGYVTSIQTAYNPQYNNVTFWMADAADGGNVLEAYRAACASAEEAPNVGDKVAVTGSLTKYNSTPEFAAGCTYVILERAAAPENLGEKTIAEFLALANTKDTCILTGVVDSILNTTYGNLYMSDETAQVYVYGVLTVDGQSKQFESLDVAVGDTMTIKAVYFEFNNAPQAKNAVFVEVKKAVPVESQVIYLNMNDANAEVLFVNNCSSVGWWEMFAQDDTYYISLSNYYTVDVADGTYTAAELDADYSYIITDGGDTRITFSDGSITLVTGEDSVIIDGSLTGSDQNIYNLHIAYTVVPVDTLIYLYGSMNDYEYNDAYIFEKNLAAQGDEWMFTTQLNEGDMFYIVTKAGESILSYYPAGGFTVSAYYAGEKTIYYRADYYEPWADFGGHFYIEKNVIVPDTFYLNMNKDNANIQYVDYCASSGWWQMKAQNNTYNLSLSNYYTVDVADGTYTAAELDANYSYISTDGGDTRITFIDGSVTLVSYEDSVVVSGQLTGTDANVYCMHLVYEIVPVDSTTVYFVNVPEWTDVHAYVWNNEEMDNYGEWPGNLMTLTDIVYNGKQVYSFTFPSYYDRVIFNNGNNGAGNQTPDQTWNEATPYFYDGLWYASLDDINPEAVAKFYISGNSNLVGAGSVWDPKAIKSLEDTYVLHLQAGYYELKISLEGDTNTWKGFSDLTAVTEGLTGWEENNAIAFTLAEEGDVTVTYSVVNQVTTFTVTGTFFTIESGYYLLGVNTWSLLDLTPADKLSPNGEVEGEWMINTTLTENNYIRVAFVYHNVFVQHYGDYYLVDADHAGAKTVYFRPNGNEAWSEFGGYIYIEPNTLTDFEEIVAPLQAVKVLRNGQLIIIKNGVEYNVQGALIRK